MDIDNHRSYCCLTNGLKSLWLTNDLQNTRRVERTAGIDVTDISQWIRRYSISRYKVTQLFGALMDGKWKWSMKLLEFCRLLGFQRIQPIQMLLNRHPVNNQFYIPPQKIIIRDNPTELLKIIPWTSSRQYWMLTECSWVLRPRHKLNRSIRFTQRLSNILKSISMCPKH